MTETTLLCVLAGVAVVLLVAALAPATLPDVGRLRMRQVSLLRQGVQVRLDRAQLDVRALVTTDDGAAIHMHYLGVMAPGEAGPRIITAPLFEAGDERYTWLNGVQAIAVGAPGANTVDYDVYRVL